jgi:hypothetical protein
VLDRVYGAVAWQRVDQIRYNIKERVSNWLLWVLFLGDGVIFGLKPSFNNKYDWEGTQEKAGEISLTTSYMTNSETYR